ncbi:MAG: MFS transporter [Spirochaetes bacterium]|nr:MAG: MFS transporter [Spirochaetota bacterium]
MTVQKYSKRNFKAFVWHAVFLALTKNFADINTVIPTMLIQAGGTPFHLGILTTIMVGGSKFMQIFFAAFLTHKERTKKYLFLGIYLRVGALLILGYLLFFAGNMEGKYVIAFILFLMTIFSFAGAFAGIAYNDILGKSIAVDSRKRFLILKQILGSTAVLISALVARKILTVYSYPVNYSILFVLAGLFLLVGSGSFWVIREKVSTVTEALSLRKKFALFGQALAKDKVLRNYLYAVNTTSLGIAIIPFLIALAKKNFELTSTSVGNYLLLQVAGVIVATILFKFMAKKQGYRGIMTIHILSGALLPIAALLLQGNPNLFMLLFPLSGLVLASKEIAVPGILLEISNNNNRAIYTGISGAGSVATIIFPIAAGALITVIGFAPVFILASLLILSSLVFSVKIHCRGSRGT